MNYRNYYLSVTEWIRLLITYLILDIVIAYLFYDSMIAFLIGLSGLFWYVRYFRRQAGEKRSEKIKQQFIELILSVSSRLKAGEAAENAFCDAIEDMEKRFGNGSMIVNELKIIRTRLNNNITLEWLLTDMGSRSGVIDIEEFSQVFSIARSNGGEMKSVIEQTVRMMQEKHEIEEEIAVMLSGRKLEQRVMCIIPLVILGFLRLEAADFLRVMYHNPLGILVMSCCLGIYFGSFVLTERIIRIKV